MKLQLIIIGKPHEISPQLARLQRTGIAPAGKTIQSNVQYFPLKRETKTEHRRPITWHRQFTIYSQTLAAAWIAGGLISDAMKIGATFAQNMVIIATGFGQ